MSLVMADLRLAWYTYRRPGSASSDRLYVLTAPTPLWHAGDVAAALEIQENLEHLAIAHYPVNDGEEPAAFLTTDRLRELAEAHPHFLERMEWILSCVAAGLAPMRPANAVVRSSFRDPDPIVDVRADTFTVTGAASILSRDPLIDVGRESLFQYLRDLGWIERDHDAFVPTAESIDAGMLARNRIWSPSTKVAYNQVRVTRAGVFDLHARLGGISDLTIDAPTTPTLLEI